MNRKGRRDDNSDETGKEESSKMRDMSNVIDELLTNCLLTKYQTQGIRHFKLSFFFQFKSWRVGLKTDTSDT